MNQACRICKNYFKIENGNFTCDYSIFTDGVSVFKKSNACIWPIYMVFNKIPYKDRYTIGNFCILGIYFGSIKPNLQLLYELAFGSHLKSLNNPFLFDNVVFKFIFRFLICDKPAKSMSLNIQSSNATYFCPLCLAESSTKVINNKKHIFIPLSHFFDSEVRTEAGFLSLAYSSSNLNHPEYGVKGYCYLSNIKSFSIIDSNVIDYMHSVCLGIVRRTIDLFLTNFSEKKQFLAECRKITADLSFPSSISINCLDVENLKNWKAKDFRTFLMYVTPMFLLTQLHIVDEVFSPLREGIKLLFQNHITHQTSDQALCKFKDFIYRFSKLFEECNLTPNFHDLCHLPSIVENSGSLHEFSAFNFEHLNGLLLKKCRGNRRLDKQIILKFNYFINDFNNFNSCSEQFLKFRDHLFNRKKWKSSNLINDKFYFCGKNDNSVLKKNEAAILSNSVSFNSVRLFKRAVYYEKLISTDKYDLDKKTKHSFFVSKDFKNFFEVTRLGIATVVEESTLFSFIIGQKYKLTKLSSCLFKRLNKFELACFSIIDFSDNYLSAIRFNSFVVPEIKTEPY